MVADEIRRLLESWRDNKRKATNPASNTSQKARMQPPGGARGGRFAYH
jgi:hypothetical protein